MISSLFARRAALVPALALIAAMAACENTDSPTAPVDAPVVMLGRVASVSQPGAGAAPAPSLTSSSSTLVGIEVSVEGGTATDVTDDSGNFQLEIEGGSEEIRLRFRRGDIDVRLSLSGLPAGAVIQLEIGLEGSSATVLSSRDSRDDEFEGIASLVSIEGTEPARTLRVDLVEASRTERVSIVEGVTLFDNEGDILTFSGLHAALVDGSLVVKIEGEGERNDDGSTTANVVKVETDDDSGTDDDSDDSSGSDDDGSEGPGEFEGIAALIAIEGEAPARTIRVELAGLAGTVLVDIAEGVTLFDNEGDILSFGDLLAALDRGDRAVKIEGDGRVEDDGSVSATAVKVETSEDPGDGTLPGDDTPGSEGPAEFSGTAALVSVEGETSARTVRVELTRVAGSVLVDIADGATVFDGEGDILSIDALLVALDRSDLTVTIEGAGAPAGDGSIAAASVKVETSQTP